MNSILSNSAVYALGDTQGNTRMKIFPKSLGEAVWLAKSRALMLYATEGEQKYRWDTGSEPNGWVPVTKRRDQSGEQEGF